MVDGRSTGTMALTEPGQGSTLADITTSAHVNEDSSYLIRGQRSHSNAITVLRIIHLVLPELRGHLAALVVFRCSSCPNF